MSIKIAHLYGDLLNLYGSEGNIKALVRRLEDCGETVEVKEVSIDKPGDITGSNLIYIGPGTEKRTLLALEDLRRQAGILLDSMSYGSILLCSGSSSYLFGESVTGLDGVTHEGIGFGSFTTVFDEKRRYSEYIMKTLVTAQPVVGCINTSATVTWKSEDSLFDVVYTTNPIISEKEGLLTTDMILTEMQGPLLWRNPDLLDYVASKAAGHPLRARDEDWYKAAVRGYESVLASLEKASGKDQ